MAVKFIDRNRKGEVSGDEIVVRCSCGCGFVTISAIQEQDYNTKETSCQHFCKKFFYQFYRYFFQKPIDNGAGVWYYILTGSGKRP